MLAYRPRAPRGTAWSLSCKGKHANGADPSVLLVSARFLPHRTAELWLSLAQERMREYVEAWLFWEPQVATEKRAGDKG